MENDKYYTPALEDLRIGYELELYDDYDHMKWIKHILTSDKLKRYSFEWMTDPDKSRVPYLTKEDLTREGWNGQSTEDPEDGTWLMGYKNGHKLSYLLSEKRMCIFIDEDLSLFVGYCPSVNELRTIEKLLRINE